MGSITYGSNGMMNAVFSQAKFYYMAKQYDVFDMMEKNGHYVFTYEGSGQAYKNVIYGALKETKGSEFFKMFIDNISEASGTLKLIVDQDSYRYVGVESTHHFTMNMAGVATESTSESSYHYSQFNQVGTIKIPEAVENAKALGDFTSKQMKKRMEKLEGIMGDSKQSGKVNKRLEELKKKLP